MASQTLPLQPDFAFVATSLRHVSDHLERCQNLPSIAGTARLEALMQAMMMRLDTIQETVSGVQTTVAGLQTQLVQVDQRVQRLDAKSDTMAVQLKAMDRNSIARMENNIAMRPENTLAPLYSIETGELIPGFPEKFHKLLELNSRQMSEILRHLGQPNTGTTADMKRRLKIAVGITTEKN